jgi:hypothetical protein
MKKKLDERSIANELKDGSVFFARTEPPAASQPAAEPQQRVDASQTQDIETPKRAKAQETTQVSKGLSKPLSKSVSKPLRSALTTDEIEALAFRLRKERKARINADVPAVWKQQLDDLAHALGVGKYDLVMYIIANFLDKAGPGDRP